MNNKKMNNLEVDYLSEVNVDVSSEEETSTLPKNVKKYNKTIDYIEQELYTTLNYLNNQLDIIDVQIGENQEGVATPFNRNVYEAKKNIVEQKLSALRALSSISSDSFKITAKSKDDEVVNITSLFQN